MKNIACSLAVAASLASPVAHAGGDASNGKLLYASRCIACHSIEVSLAGPAHRGVYGRKAGSVADFEYSPALKKSKLVWTEANLDKWLTNPEKLIPGQKMGYAVPDAKDRADLIAYLKTQSGH
ncbi:MAG: c-type cytochrome [Pseudomonadota bacterium]